MKKTELIKGILELGESLKDAEGMGALVDINEMELLVDKYVQELGQLLPIDSVSQRSELLLAYTNFIQQPAIDGAYTHNEYIEMFLSQ